MKNIFISLLQANAIKIIIFLLAFVSCKNEGTLRKLNYDEMYKRFEEKKFLTKETNLYDTKGKLLSHDTLEKCLPDKFFVDYYVNKRNEVIKAVLRPATPEDIAFFNKVNRMLLNPKYKRKEVKINCSKKDEYLKRALYRDQKIRKESGNLISIDHTNLDTVSSILDKCNPLDWSDVPQTSYDAIFFVLHHNSLDDRLHYKGIIQYFFDKGYLSASKKALWIDRILMEQGKPQIYGTQILNGQLYILKDSSNIDILRKEMGLPPLKEYLDRFGIKWK